MQAVFREILAELKNVHPYAKRLVRTLLPVVVSLYIAGLFCYALRAFGNSYSYYDRMLNEVLYCAAQCTAAVLLPAQLLDMLYRFGKNKN